MDKLVNVLFSQLFKNLILCRYSPGERPTERGQEQTRVREGLCQMRYNAGQWKVKTRLSTGQRELKNNDDINKIIINNNTI